MAKGVAGIGISRTPSGRKASAIALTNTAGSGVVLGAGIAAIQLAPFIGIDNPILALNC